MKKGTVKLMIWVMMLLATALYFISGTYARYTSTFSGTAKTIIAAWNVKVKDSVDKTFELEFTKANNEFVVNNKIAPGVTLKSQAIPIDLTGTEVAVDVNVTIDTKDETYTQALSKLGESANDLTVTAEVYKGETGEDEKVTATEEGKPIKIALDNGEAFTSDNGKYHIIVTATWNDVGGAHDVSDTNAGKTSYTDEIDLQIPVKVELKQHLAIDD